MATCNESIAAMGSFDSLTEIIPNTVTPFNVTATNNRLFKLMCPQVQTVKFNIASTSSPVALTLTVYSWNGTTASVIGSVNITNPNAIAQIDFQIGNYIICLRPSGFATQTGTLLGEFTGYSQEARIAVSMADGAHSSVVLSGPPSPPRECNEALFFEIMDGELPPGLQMDPFGVITGVLPNLDCLEDRWSPAVNWYYEENDGTSWPWGREWRFQVRVWVDGLEETAWAEDWFCVRIHNNWTYDQERFLAQQPFEHVSQVRVVDPPKTLPTICQPCKNFEEEPMFVPQKIEDTKECLPCQKSTQDTKVELIPIPLDLCKVPSSEYLQWFIANEDVKSDNPHIEKFKQDLKESPAFTHLRARAGYLEHTESEEEIQRQFVVVQNYQNFLQLATITLNDGAADEYKSIVREWQVIENQVLPTQAIGYAGDTMEITLR